MTGTQLLVLALLAAAFGAGWIAGRNGDEQLELRMPRADLLNMLEAATSAIGAAITTRTTADLRRLGEMRDAMVEALGPDHPLADDIEQVGRALALAADETNASIGSALEGAARTAANRFYRSAAAITGLEPD